MEEIKNFIRKKIEEIKREIILEGERERIKILNEYEEEKKEILKRAKKEINEKLRMEEIKRVNEVERKNKNEILKKREEILKDILKNLEEEKKKINWDYILPKFFDEALKKFEEKEGIVRVKKDFYEILKKEVEKRNLNFKVVKDDIDEGLVLETNDGKIRIYNTFSSRIERAKNYILEILKRELNV
jgi:vacuolar-type H+-ATPase subunit E/Vma4